MLHLLKLKKPRPKNPPNLGQQGEQRAKKFLQNKGLRFLASNFRTPYGEIDLIFRDGAQIVFVEVKTRATIGKGQPYEAVDPRKLNHIQLAAQTYLQQNHLNSSSSRIDVVSIVLKPKTQIQHLINVTGF